MFNEGVLLDPVFTELYHDKLQRLASLDKKAADDLVTFLNAGVCKSYFREMAQNILWQVLKIDFSKQEDQLNLCAKYNYAKGALEVLDTLIKIGDKNE